jgi:hypothetical protein
MDFRALAGGEAPQPVSIVLTTVGLAEERSRFSRRFSVFEQENA